MKSFVLFLGDDVVCFAQILRLHDSRATDPEARLVEICLMHKRVQNIKVGIMACQGSSKNQLSVAL